MQTTHLPGRDLVAAVISSIGVRHDGAHALVTDGLYLDLSRALRNPAADSTMRYRTGLDDDVHAHVLATPGALEVILRTAVQLRALADETPVGRLVRLTTACQAGRHRAVDRTCDRVSAEQPTPVRRHERSRTPFGWTSGDSLLQADRTTDAVRHSPAQRPRRPEHQPLHEVAQVVQCHSNWSETEARTGLRPGHRTIPSRVPGS
ncbi:hypothetical protein ACFUJU_25795 [Streptomyces sp. NPDC057235]|uniref:RapZ C-terminal domain-containing protein n=1 Tax=Streptomyces sp. NPDC057235 TaxID=3346058 RepID=UPI0036366BFB